MILAGSAAAATGYVASGSIGDGPGSGDGEFAHPQRIAVDHDNGDVYLVDSENDRVQVFDAAGSYLTQIGGLDDPFGIAIDQSASPISVYVSHAGGIAKLDSDGGATPAFAADAGFTSPAGGAGEGDLGDFHAPLSFGGGQLFVADRGDDLVQVYDGATGDFLDDFSGADSPDGAFTSLEDLAVGNGHLYVVDARGGTANEEFPSRLLQFSTAGVYEETLRPLQGEGDGLVAVDPNNGNVLVGDVRFFAGRVHVLDSSGTWLNTFKTNADWLTGLAVDGVTTGALYAASDDSCGGLCEQPVGAQVLTPALFADSVVNPVVEFDTDSATFSGSVDPNGGADTVAFFEYSSDGENWQTLIGHNEFTDPGLDGGDDPVALTRVATELAQNTTYLVRLAAEGPAGRALSATQEFTTEAIPAPEATIDPVVVDGVDAHFTGSVDPNGFPTKYRFEFAVDDGSPDWDYFGGGSSASDAPVAIEADRTLTAGVDYLARVVATNGGGTATSSEVGFSVGTGAPTVRVLPGSGRTTTSVRLNGTVTANGLPTTYRFEYGPTASYGSSIPVSGPGLSAGQATEMVRYSKPISGLEPGEAVHYRLIAENAAGASVSPDQVVETLAGEPAFEMVTPPDKNGAEPSDLEGAQTTPDGSGLMFGSSGGFAGAEGVFAINGYVSRRGADGWTTHGLALPQTSSANVAGRTTTDASLDLRRSFGVSSRVLAPGAIEGQGNLYLKDHETGEVSYIASGPFQPLSNTGFSKFVGGSDDFSTVVFFFDGGLTNTPGIPEASRSELYQFTDGKLSVVSQAPDGTPFPGALEPESGGVVLNNAVSADGSRIYFRAKWEGGVWLREDASVTIPVSASHRPGDLGAVYSAEFGGASNDGSVVYFTSGVPLAANSQQPEQSPFGAPSTSPSRLYRWERESEDLSEVLFTPAAFGGGTALRNVLRVSDDGTRVYFTLDRAVDGSNRGQTHLYAWSEEDGTQLIAADFHTQAEDYLSTAETNSISPDGTKFAFESRARLTAGETRNPKCFYNGSAGPESGDEIRGFCSAVYLYDAVDGSLDCVSCNPSGAAPVDDETIGGFIRGVAARSLSFSAYEVRAVDDEGRVYFDSRSRLVPEDTDGRLDAYRWDAGQLDLIAPGTETDTTFADASVDGSSVFFRTRDQLVGIDIDGSEDFYVSRIGGGLASQNPPPPEPPCEGDACQGDGRSAPGWAPPSSGSLPDAPAGQARVEVGKAKPVRGTSAKLSVTLPEPGMVRVTGSHLEPLSRKFKKAGTYRLTVKLDGGGRKALRRTGRLRTPVTVRFTPATGEASRASAVLTFTGRRTGVPSTTTRKGGER